MSQGRNPLTVVVGVCPALAIESGEVKSEPDAAPLVELIGLLDSFDLWFPVIEP